MDTNNVYPSLEELFKSYGANLPIDLKQDIQERYEKFGGKYLTGDRHTDGRVINLCMQSNSAQDAIEEVIDAVFNVLVLDVKKYNVAPIFYALVKVYEDLAEMRALIKQIEETK